VVRERERVVSQVLEKHREGERVVLCGRYFVSLIVYLFDVCKNKKGFVKWNCMTN